MILELVILDVRPGEEARFETAFAEAQRLVAGVPGYLSHELGHCLEQANRYALLIRWRRLEDHDPGFRSLPQYQEWKRLLHHFYEPFPKVEHYQRVHGPGL